MKSKSKVAKKKNAVKTKSTKKNNKTIGTKYTHICLVIDRSGSMTTIEDSTFKCINEQLEAIRRDQDKTGITTVSYIQFDDQIETVFKQVKTENLKDITKDQYQPRGLTALYDATDEAINLLSKETTTDNTGFLVIVISDGEENASHKCNQKTLAEKIQKLQDTGKWTFTYMMGNNVNLAVIKALNVPVGNINSFATDTQGMNIASSTISTSYSSYSATRGMGLTSTGNFYDDKDEDDKNVNLTKKNDKKSVS